MEGAGSRAVLLAIPLALSFITQGAGQDQRFNLPAFSRSPDLQTDESGQVYVSAGSQLICKLIKVRSGPGALSALMV